LKVHQTTQFLITGLTRGNAFMTLRDLLKAGYCLLALSALPFSNAQAAVSSQGAGDAGILVGAAFANHDIGTHVTWGLTTHYNLLPEINVGLYYNRYSNDTTVPGGTKFTTSYNNIAAEANYLFKDMLEGAYAGAKFGLAITSVDLPNASDRYNVVFGPAIGYDYMIGNGISAGGQFNILWTTGDPVFADTNLLFVLKYNFF
jgi:hypothetical protein